MSASVAWSTVSGGAQRRSELGAERSEVGAWRSELGAERSEAGT